MDPIRKNVSYFAMSIVFGMILLLFFGCESAPFKNGLLRAMKAYGPMIIRANTPALEAAITTTVPLLKHSA